MPGALVTPAETAARTGLQAPTIPESLLLLAAIPVAMLAHEAAHYAVAWLLRLDPDWHLSVGSSMYVAYDDASAAQSALVRLAPLGSGLGGSVAAVALLGWPGASYEALAVVLGWFFYAIRESGQDVRDVVGELEPWREDGIKGLLALDVATLVLLSPYGASPIVQYAVAWPTVVAGIALLMLARRDGPDRDVWKKDADNDDVDVTDQTVRQSVPSGDLAGGD